MASIRFSVLVALLILLGTAHGVRVDRRTFLELGCMGTFSRENFARLDRVCEECYLMFREPAIQRNCRSNCFRNENFNTCVGALLLKEEEQALEQKVNSLYGPRN